MLIGLPISIIIVVIACLFGVISWDSGISILILSGIIAAIITCLGYEVISTIVTVTLTIIGLTTTPSIEEKRKYEAEYVSYTTEYTNTEEKFELLSLKQMESTYITSNEHTSKDTTVVGGFFLVVGAADVDTEETSQASAEVLKKEYIVYWALGENGIAKRYTTNIDDMEISFLEDNNEKPYLKHITQIRHDYRIDSNKETKEETASSINFDEYIFYLPKSILEELPISFLQ